MSETMFIRRSAHVSATCLLVASASLSCGQGVSSSPAGDASHDVATADSADSGDLADSNRPEVGSRDSGMTDGGGADAPRMEAGAVVTLPLSGCYNAHTLPVVIGGSQHFALNLDTGSASLGVAAEGCSSCVEAGVSPLYEPGSGAVDLHQTVNATYDTGELGWTGEAYRDTVSMGGLGAPVDFGAISSQASYFFPDPCDTPDGSVSGAYQGIVGFGPDHLLLPGTTGYFDQIVKANLVSNVFAIELCHVGGSITLGGYDPTKTTGPVQYTPMTGSADAYTIGWTAVTAGAAAAISLPPGGSGAIVDSGGSEIIVPDATFQAIAGALEQDSAIQSMLGSTWFSSTVGDYVNCVTLDQTPSELDATLPPLTLTLGSTSPIQVVLTATQSYLTYAYLSSSQVQYCQALIDGTATYGDLYYLGQSLMLGHVLVYDRAGSRFGVAPGIACPY